MKKKVFLGGTCNNSAWRDELIPLLKIDYFNPVVKDWTPECQKQELEERGKADFVLYVLTPLMTGVYSLAEAVDDSNKRPKKTVFCYLLIDGGQSFTTHQIKSLVATGKLIVENGGRVCHSLQDVADLLNEPTVPFYGDGY